MDTQVTDERGIIREVLSGNREAFAGLVRAHQAKVMSLCLSLLRDPAEAEDAAQDVFIKAYRGLSGFRFDSSFSTWLYRVAYRRCLDLLKARKRRGAESLDALLDARGDVLFPEPPPRLEERAEMEKILSSLPAEYRLLLTLREAQGLSYDELSRATDASLDSVKARLRRARRALQEAARHFWAGAGVQTGGGVR